MSKKEEDDVSLPKATITKIIKEHLKSDIRCANDTREMISDCCVEFVQLLANEANDLCSKENKKTVSAQHILDSLKNLGFDRYIKQIEELNESLKLDIQKQTKQQKKNSSGLTEDELLQEQQKLFAQARSNHPQFQKPTSSTPSTPTSPFASPSVNSHSFIFNSYQPQKVQLKKKEEDENIEEEE